VGRAVVDRTFLRFALVGVSNTLITVLSYAAMIELGVGYALAATLGYVLGVFNGYTWNRLWTFEAGPFHLPEFSRYVLVYVAGLAANLLLLFLLIEKAGVALGAAEIISVVPVVLLTYSANRWWTFSARIRTRQVGGDRAG